MTDKQGECDGAQLVVGFVVCLYGGAAMVGLIADLVLSHFGYGSGLTPSGLLCDFLQSLALG